MILFCSKSDLLVILRSQGQQEEKGEWGKVDGKEIQEHQRSSLRWCSKGSLNGLIPVSIAVNPVLLWNILYSSASWSCNAAQGWKWQLVYAAIWWWTAALPHWWVRLNWPWAGPPANKQRWGFGLLVHYAQHELLNSFGVLFSSVDYVSHPLGKLGSLRTVSPFPSVQEGEQEQLTFTEFVALADMKLFCEVCLSTNWT